MAKYRFENGRLFKLDASKNAYIHVFRSIYAETKAQAIRMYEQQEKYEQQESKHSCETCGIDTEEPTVLCDNCRLGWSYQ